MVLKRMNWTKKRARMRLLFQDIKPLLTWPRSLMWRRKVSIQQCRSNHSIPNNIVISSHLIHQLKELIISICLINHKYKSSNLLPGRRNRSPRNNKIENIWRRNYSIRVRKTLRASLTHRALSNNSNKRSSYWEIWIMANRWPSQAKEWKISNRIEVPAHNCLRILRRTYLWLLESLKTKSIRSISIHSLGPSMKTILIEMRTKIWSSLRKATLAWARRSSRRMPNEAQPNQLKGITNKRMSLHL